VGLRGGTHQSPNGRRHAVGPNEDVGLLLAAIGESEGHAVRSLGEAGNLGAQADRVRTEGLVQEPHESRSPQVNRRRACLPHHLLDIPVGEQPSVGAPLLKAAHRGSDLLNLLLET
jgi:hypothetical protein